MTVAEVDPPTTQLPPGWLSVKVGTLFEVVGGGTPDTKIESYWQGQIPWISSADITPYGRITARRHVSSEAVAASATAVVPAGSLIVVTRVGLGKVAVAEYALCFSQDSQALLFQNLPLNVDYVAYYLRQAARNFRFQSRGTTIPGITKKQLLDVSVPLPPLPEQARIVSKIEELFSKLDAGVAELKRTQALLKRYRQSLLHAAVTGELTREWRQQQGAQLVDAAPLLAGILAERRRKWEANGKKGKYKEPQGPDVAGLPELPPGWVWASVEQVAEIGTGATPLKGERRFYDGGTIPWVTSGAMNSDLITEPTAYITDAALQETNAKIFPVGTLLVAMYGEGKTRGKVGELAIPAATNQACAALTCATPNKTTQFIKLFFRWNYDNLRRSASGGVQPNLSLGIIKEIIIPLPPLAEQNQIVSEVERRLSILDNMEATVSAELKRAESTRQSILHRAFTGQLVPQDATDEPASVLLDRIQAEKLKAGAKAIREGTGRRGRPRKLKEVTSLFSE